jgi:DNA-binding beta-propeller fold protein YncE
VATITWAKPAVDSAGVAKYIVTATPSKKSCVFRTPLAEFRCVISGLKIGTSYSFTVAARNKNGGGSTSAPSPKVKIVGLPTSANTSVVNDPSFHQPGSVVSNGTDVWVANFIGGSNGNGFISEINASTNTVTEIDDPSINQPTFIALNGTDLWVVNYHGGPNALGSISVIDTATNAVTQINDPSFNGPCCVTFDDGYAWVLNTSSAASDSIGSISKINLTTDAVTVIASNSFQDPQDIVSSGDYVWVADVYGGPGSGAVSKIDVVTDAITDITKLNVIHNPYDLATNGKEVWVASSNTGLALTGTTAYLPLVATINTSTDAVSATYGPLPGDSRWIAFDGTNVWFLPETGLTGSYLYEENAATGKVLQVDTDGLVNATELAADGKYVWITDSASGTNQGSVEKISEASKP